jgi:hypothetical protein
MPTFIQDNVASTTTVYRPNVIQCVGKYILQMQVIF